MKFTKFYKSVKFFFKFAYTMTFNNFNSKYFRHKNWVKGVKRKIAYLSASTRRAREREREKIKVHSKFSCGFAVSRAAVSCRQEVNQSNNFVISHQSFNFSKKNSIFLQTFTRNSAVIAIPLSLATRQGIDSLNKINVTNLRSADGVIEPTKVEVSVYW